MTSIIDIVIVNWNSGKLLNNCINSLASTAADISKNIIVVDNSSTDGSDEIINKHKNISFIETGTNLGFGKACNLGAKLFSSDYILFLNPDAELLCDSLKKSVEFMQMPANKQVGICGVQLIDESGNVSRSCTRFPHALSFFAHSLGIVHFFPRAGHFMTEWPHDKTREVNHVIGAFFMVRRSLFEELGGFDERFFVYLEDLDFSYRSHKAGWKTVFIADIQAFHVGGGTSNKVKARRLFYSLRSRLLYSFKHFSRLGAVGVLLATLLVEPLSRSVLASLRCSWSGLKETWSAYGMLWRWLPQWMLNGVVR